MKHLLSNFSEIYCKDGILRIQKITPNTIVLDNKNEETPIIKNEAVDKIKFYNLTLKNGAIVSLGENTLLTTTEGLKKIQDINIDDYILHRFSFSQNFIGKKEIISDYVVLNAIHNPIKIPKNMNEDLALWLGIISSKGRYYEDSGYVAVSLNDKIIGKLFHELTIKLFKIKPKIFKDKNSGYLQHYISSVNLVRFLKNSLGVNSNLKKVPQQLLEGSIYEQLAFIKGLSLDGYIENNNLVIYGGISKRLSDFCNLVLRNSGHVIYQQIRKSGQGNDIFYSKIIYSHENSYEIHALESKKNDGLEKGGFLVKVTPEILKTKVSIKNPGYSAFRNLKQRGSKTCYNHTLDQLNIPYPKNDYFVMVKSIKTEIQSGFSLETKSGSLNYNGLILGDNYEKT